MHLDHFAVADTHKIDPLAPDLLPRGGYSWTIGCHLQGASIGPGERHLSSHLILADDAVFYLALHIRQGGEPTLNELASRGLAVHRFWATHILPHDVIGQYRHGPVCVVSIPACNKFLIQPNILLDRHNG